ncbi:MAG: biotin--[acetyl-CoA-carboxylase] ligase [Clostridia bacterium]|nr:biotin--[acetyl-CoA-carboxylase] ligase [Clostridia bacterium]
MKFNIIKKEIVTSTNDILKDNSEIFESGTVLTAKQQTNGRGRMGRKFYSPPSGLYFSILLKDIKSNPTALTVMAAVAVMKGIYDTFGIKTQVKWVNDIFYEGKKICGILTEGAFQGNRLRYAVIGAGINVSTEYFPEELKNIAGSLNESIENSDRLLQNILENFNKEFQRIEKKEYLEFYKENCLTLNRNVELLLQDENYLCGFAFDIDEDARLIVKTENGEIKKIFFGEAKII